MKAPLPTNEAERLATLRGYGVLDTLPEQSFDDLTLLAANICYTPIALVSLVDEHRQWFKSIIGLNVAETSRDVAFCAHAILYTNEVLEVQDAQLDPRFADNPLVTADPNIRFYAGAPLVAPDGSALGTLCVIDHEPRTLDEAQKQALQALSRHVVTLLEMRRKLTQHKQAEKERDRMFNYALDIYGIANFNGYFVQVNPAWERTLGWSAEELLARPYLEFVHPDDRAATTNAAGTLVDGIQLLAALFHPAIFDVPAPLQHKYAAIKNVQTLMHA